MNFNSLLLAAPSDKVVCDSVRRCVWASPVGGAVWITHPQGLSGSEELGLYIQVAQERPQVHPLSSGSFLTPTTGTGWVSEASNSARP